MPGTLLLTEDRGMRLDARSEGNDLLLRRIGHEVAHQWWGGVVSPADVVGAGLLVEGLTTYAEQRVVAPELGLAESGYGDDYLIYGKAAVAFHALHAALGDAAMTRALRRVIATEGGPLGAASTTTLRQALDAEARTAGDALLIAQWLEQRPVYDLRVDSVQVVRGARGVQLTVVGRASTEDDHGMAGMALELGVGMPSPDAAGRERTQTVAVRTAAGGRFVGRVTLDALPTTVEVDPRFLWIDRNRSNNAKAVGGGRE